MQFKLFNMVKSSVNFYGSINFHRLPLRWMLGPYLMVVCVAFAGGCAHPSAVPTEASPYEDLLGIYRGPLNHLAPVRRGACPMYPSCSEYSRQAVEKHGFVIGWTMAMDRLLRCGRDESKRVPSVLVQGEWKFYDPLVANDTWWYSAGEDMDIKNRNAHHRP